MKIPEDELARRAKLIRRSSNGIHAPFEAFYIRSILFSAGRCLDAFHRLAAAGVSNSPAGTQVSLVHEALVHASALSRFFWPATGGSRAKALRALTQARGEKLRSAFSMDETSPIYERGLRNALEHYDEALDDFLLTAGAGNFFPDPQVGQIPSPQEVPSHHFKLLDPGTSRFVLLGELYEFGLIQKEVDRIHAEATRMDANGCRL